MKDFVYPCDLHSHTTGSDGNDSFEELIAFVKERQLKVISVTDHDVLPPMEVKQGNHTQSAMDYALDKGIVYLPGCEFSCETDIEDCHIKVIGLNWNSPPILAMMEEIIASKSNSYVQLLEVLGNNGMPIALPDLLSFGEEIELSQLQKKRIFDFMAYRGYCTNWAEAKLLVRDNPAYSVKRKKPDATRLIQAGREAGAIVSLAHPFLMDSELPYRGKRVSRWQFIEEMIDAGLQGIECRYPYGKTAFRANGPIEALWKEIADRYAARLFLDAGSDYHNDAKKGTGNPRLLGECGLSVAEFLNTPYAGILSKQQQQLLNS